MMLYILAIYCKSISKGFCVTDSSSRINARVVAINKGHNSVKTVDGVMVLILCAGDGRVERWCWVNFQCRGVLLIRIIVGQGPTALAVGADGVVWTFFLSSIFSRIFLPPSGRRPDID